MRTFTIAERRNRLAHRHFLANEDGPSAVTAITAALVGLHATDPVTPYLSLWARSAGFVTADLDRELYQTHQSRNQKSVARHRCGGRGPARYPRLCAAR